MEYIVKELDGIRVFKKGNAQDMKLTGAFASAVRFVERNQICEVELWNKFVEVFRTQEDGSETLSWRSWRGEFWGKMMRASAMIVRYTNNSGMYRILESSVKDMLTTQAPSGRISAYDLETEFTSWDLWERKYVMLGMMYFLEICRDLDLEQRLLRSLCGQADYIMLFVGHGKRDIRKCSKHWGGMNSCSLLEPMVRLYRLTGDQRYLDFSEYIISTGFTDQGDIIELAYEDRLAPHEYPVIKAYEMMSCFEGLLQYYCITGIEKYRIAVENFGNRILKHEVSIIGCCGAKGELFNHTAIKQTKTDREDIMQETCVTVTWMKLAQALLELTGDARYADSIEQAFYNAYMGALNTDRVPHMRYRDQEVDVPQVMPFDSYSPLVADTRGRRVGGYGLFDDGTFYGCCACIGGAGAGVIPQMAIMRNTNGIVLNFYENGELHTQTPQGREMHMQLQTAYPYGETVVVTLSLQQAEMFDLILRVPLWCKQATIQYAGEEKQTSAGYMILSRHWKNGDRIVLNFSMPVVKLSPASGADNEHLFNAYRKGPVVLAADQRICDPEQAYDVASNEHGEVDYEYAACREIPDCRLCVTLKLTDHTSIRLIDYASAGKTWSQESKMAAWLKNGQQENDREVD